MQEIGIESSVLKNILDGNKTIEGRLGKDKFLKLKVGDNVSLREDIYQNGEIKESLSNQAIVRITQILHFSSFKEMLESLDFKAIIPRAKDVEEALAVYRQFYSVTDEKEYGVIAISFELR